MSENPDNPESLNTTLEHALSFIIPAINRRRNSCFTVITDDDNHIIAIKNVAVDQIGADHVLEAEYPPIDYLDKNGQDNLMNAITAAESKDSGASTYLIVVRKFENRRIQAHPEQQTFTQIFPNGRGLKNRYVILYVASSSRSNEDIFTSHFSKSFVVKQ